MSHARVSLTLMCATALACGGGMDSVVSYPSPGDIEVDGVQGEWGEVLAPLAEEGMWFGAMNDDEAVYLTFVTNRVEFAQQILLTGVTLWLDAGGDKRRELGLRFPLAVSREARMMGGESSAGLPGAAPGGGSGGFPRGSGGGQGRGRAGAPADPEQTRQMLERVLANAGDSVEVIISGEEPVTYRLSELPGVELKLAFSHSALVYEIRVPLSDDPNLPFAIAAGPGAYIAVGLTTPERRRPGEMGPGSGGRGGMGGGRGGAGGIGGGGRGGAGGMGMRSGRPSMPERLDIWAQVELVVPETPPQREP